jgi:eukaryotic-like serine/threonine-protein kinase
MTPERYQQISQLYDQALQLETEARAAFLEQACADDDELRQEVARLLSAHKQAGSFLGAPAMEVAAGAFATALAGGVTGRSFGHYRILRPLGAGGMGEVYLAHDARLDRQLAIKLLPEQFTTDAARLQRFVQEAKAASALNHPNIITIYDVGEADGAHYIAFELIAGQTLRRHMRGARLQVNEAVDIATQIASAVAAAHSAGIIHRDLKPENVMVRPDGVVKVLDFGLAKLPQRQAKPSQPPVDTEAQTLAYQQIADAENLAPPAHTLTVPGMLLGTVRYMSPEQARGLTVDGRTDIFSLGVVFYEMLTGHAPFEGETASDLIAAILTSEPPAHEMPDAPAELQRILAKTLRKDKAARYQTSAELLADLKELQQELAFAAKQRRGQHTEAALFIPARVAALAGGVAHPRRDRVVGVAWPRACNLRSRVVEDSGGSQLAQRAGRGLQRRCVLARWSDDCFYLNP